MAIDYLATSLKNHGIEVDFLDLAFSENVEEDIERALQKESPLAVGVTIRNIDDSFFASQDFCLEKTKAFIDLIKRHTNTPLVLGGVGFSIAPIPALQYCGVDFGIWGEGEKIFPLFVKALADGSDYGKIPGLLWKDNTGYCINAASYFNLQKLDLSGRDTVDNLRYYQEGGMVGFETKRGCNQTCHYCADPLGKGTKIRLRHPEDVASELKGLAEKGIFSFHTCDSEFNIPTDHALEVCKQFVRKKLGDKINWYAYASPFGFSRELALWMRKAGCRGINFGVDSGNSQMLKNLGRNHTPDDIREVARICHNHGFAFMLDLLLGGPGENRKTVRETIELMKAVNPSRAGISLGVRIYAGTYFGKTLGKIAPVSGGGFFGNMSDGILRPFFYLSPGLGEGVQEFIRGLIAGDVRFFFGGAENIDENYNYNDNTKLIQTIKKGYRGAFWDILRRVEEAEKD